MASLTVTEAAGRLGVSRETVYQWERSGKLRRLADGRVSEKEVQRLTTHWRPTREEAAAAVDAADALLTLFKQEESRTLEQLEEACCRVAKAREKGDQKAKSTAIVDVQRAAAEYRVVGAELWPRVKGMLEAAAEVGRDILGTAPAK